MIAMSLSKAAVAIESSYSGKDVMFSGCSTDSRTLQKGNLFIALKGENFNGHDYVTAAEEKGASSLMLEHEVTHELPVLKVENTRKAMGLLARSWRDEITIPLVAITGSNGKTTVKEMVTSILSEIADVHATSGNLNNDIGVPLTLFGLDKSHQYAVIEMGANHPGEIEWLSAIARPNVAVITQCAPAHLEGFGSIEGVAHAKAEIYSGLQVSGTAIINADDDYFSFWREISQQNKQLTFGIDSTDADVSATNINLTTTSNHVQFDCCYAGEIINILLPLAGKHNVMNALAATACCLSLDVSMEVIKKGLENIQPIKGRLQLKQGRQGSLIIDDTYNANPTSLKAGLDVLKTYQGKRYLVLGDMGELGDAENEIHHEAGLIARHAEIDGLFTIGRLSIAATDSFGEGAKHFDSFDELEKTLISLLAEEVTVLVKGSRSMQMEQIVKLISGGRD